MNFRDRSNKMKLVFPSLQSITCATLLFCANGALAADCMSLPFQSRYLAFLGCLGKGLDPFSVHQRSIALSFLGKDQESQILFDQEKASNTRPSKPAPVDFSTYREVNAIAEIVRLSGSRKVVMLNEAHHISRHRIFALELAMAMRQAGYNYLAVEAIGDASKLLAKGYVVGSDFSAGYYTHDPEFAHFLREAIAMGYKIISYEARDGSDGAEREKIQAANLGSFVVSHPDAKLLVYAGYSHIKKNFTERYDYMAKLFREMTLIDPLTIDQDGGAWNPYAKLTDPSRTGVEDRLHSESVVFKNASQQYAVSAAYRGQVDLTVFHPQEQDIHGRPNWLTEGRQAHFVDSKNLGTQRPVAVRAMLTKEPDGVPVDQVLLEKMSDESYLFLPPGEYNIQLESPETGVQNLYSVKVGGANTQ